MPKSKTTPRANEPAPTPEPKKPTKIESLLALLRRPEGARIDEMTTATGWQSHSVRGALAGHVKKKLELTITSEKTGAGRVYRIAVAPTE